MAQGGALFKYRICLQGDKSRISGSLDKERPSHFLECESYPCRSIAAHSDDTAVPHVGSIESIGLG